MFPDTLIALTKGGDFVRNQYMVMDGGLEYTKTNLILDILRRKDGISKYSDLKTEYEKEAEKIKSLSGGFRPTRSLAPRIFELYDLGLVDLPEDPEKLKIVKELVDYAEDGGKTVNILGILDKLGFFKDENGRDLGGPADFIVKEWTDRLLSIGVIKPALVKRYSSPYSGVKQAGYVIDEGKLNDYARYYLPAQEFNLDKQSQPVGYVERDQFYDILHKNEDVLSAITGWQLKEHTMNVEESWIISQNPVENLNYLAKRLSEYTKGLTNKDFETLAVLLAASSNQGLKRGVSLELLVKEFEKRGIIDESEPMENKVDVVEGRLLTLWQEWVHDKLVYKKELIDVDRDYRMMRIEADGKSIGRPNPLIKLTNIGEFVAELFS